MYKGYCITEETINDVTLPYFYEIKTREQAYEDALAELDKKSNSITARIAKILQGDAQGIIDGDALQQACMPTTSKYDVFISHSHCNDNGESAKTLLHIC